MNLKLKNTGHYLYIEKIKEKKDILRQYPYHIDVIYD